MKGNEYHGYVARDEDGALNLFLHDMPWKTESEVGHGEWTNDRWDGVPIRNNEFEDVKWDDKAPRPVVITIIDNKKI